MSLKDPKELATTLTKAEPVTTKTEAMERATLALAAAELHIEAARYKPAALMLSLARSYQAIVKELPEEGS